MMFRNRVLPAFALAAALAGCAREGELVFDQGVGITSVLTTCPAIGIPDYTGDVTTFRNSGDATLANLDLTASITNLRSTCDDSTDRIYTEATFDIHARRSDVSGARSVTMPYFVTVLRGAARL